MSSIDLLEGWLTTDEVADKMETSRRAVLHMIAGGRLPAQTVGRMKYVHPSDLPDKWPPERLEASEV